MFGFLKKKLKDAVQKFTGSVEEEIQEEEIEQVQEEDISEAEQELLEEDVPKEEILNEEPQEEPQEISQEEPEEDLEPEEEAEQILEDEVEKVEEEIPEEESEIDKEFDEEFEEQKVPPLQQEVRPKEEEPVLEAAEQIQEELKDEEHEKEEIEEKAKQDIEHDLKEIEESKIERELEKAEDEQDIEEIIKDDAKGKQEIEEEVEFIEEEIKPKKKSFLGKIFGKKQEEKKIESEPIKAIEKEQEETPKEKKTTFTKFKETFTKKTLSEDKFEELFWELELTLLENNVAVQVIEKIKEELKKELTTGKVSRVGIDTIILQTLKKTIQEILSTPTPDLIELIKTKEEKPYVITFIGVNGSGKTTNLAKFAHLCKQNGLEVVVAACDTFRAAAIQQIENHTNNLGIRLIKQDYGADAAAVAFDAIKHAEARGADVVLIDTAGRLHSNTNLMDELAKIMRVAKPDYKIFVGEATTGNDCVEQATQFNEAIQIDGSILSKADVDDKGGAAISLSHVTGKPILYLGVGQDYKDLERFDAKKILDMIGL